MNFYTHSLQSSPQQGISLIFLEKGWQFEWEKGHPKPSLSSNPQHPPVIIGYFTVTYGI